MTARVSNLIGDILLRENKISKEDLEHGLELQADSSENLGAIFLKENIVSEESLTEALAIQTKMPYLELEDFTIEMETLKILKANDARKFKAMPLFIIDETLTIAISDPSDVLTIDEITRATLLDVEPVLSTASAIDRAIDSYYGTGELMKSRATTEEAAAEFKDFGADTAAEDVSVVQMVDMIINQAIKTSASDIHIEPREHELRIRYRVDGALQEVFTPPKKLQSAIISRVKILASLDIAETRLPQDGRIQHKIADKKVDMRISTYPTFFGEKIVIRVLDSEGAKISLPGLGLTGDTLTKYRKLIRSPNGIILVTGPTGSGKTTSLYASINEINKEELNIITIEDPIEYQLPNINQGQVNPKAGVSFSTALRSILRQDPDVIMVGEIRDIDTAALAIQAALTGHLVLSTVHTNDAAGAIARLINMGIEKFMVASTIRGVIAQRLVRKLCNECAKRYRPTDDELKALKLKPSDDIIFRKPVGCMSCRKTGYQGRTGLYEILVPNQEIIDLILSGGSSMEIKNAAVKAGMQTLRMQGLEKVIKGLTSIEEIMAITASEFEEDENFERGEQTLPAA
ncbi:MAG: Flp pilus assembly complex ATPase component TadA [Candidatus Marinimicrobia bacterium]|nr:Flp pilus assembly complex ATPase component TadA [Candidatus Neomarinimicrobiota bacterium]